MYRTHISAVELEEVLADYLDAEKIQEVFHRVSLMLPIVSNGDRIMQRIYDHCKNVPNYIEKMQYDSYLKEIFVGYVGESIFGETPIDIPEITPLPHKTPEEILPRKKECEWFSSRQFETPLQVWCKEITRCGDDLYGQILHHFFGDHGAYYEAMATVAQTPEIHEGDLDGHMDEPNAMYIVQADGSLLHANSTINMSEYSMIPASYTATVKNPLEFYKKVADKMNLYIEVGKDHPINLHRRPIVYKIRNGNYFIWK